MSSGSGSIPSRGDNSSFHFPIHELIAKRHSGRAFSSKALDTATIGSLFEAARWSASCNNEQPWSFIVTEKGNEQSGYDRLVACLVEFNVQWAQHAPLLILSVARLNFAATGKPNRHALYDLGQAAANLALQATAMGLMVHPMAGFDVQRARKEFSIPDDHEPASVIAVGYPGDPANLSEKLRQKESAPRQRKALHEFIFSGDWGRPATWL